jgi:hypothetical protein
MRLSRTEAGRPESGLDGIVFVFSEEDEVRREGYHIE